MTDIVDCIVGGCISVLFIAIAIVVGCFALGVLGSFIFTAREAWRDWRTGNE
nr:MAG TPA_asm: hypothetical protein [Caudoviricetes sp.]